MLPEIPPPNSNRIPDGTRGRRLCGLIDSIWGSEIVPILRAAPGLRPIAVVRQIYNRYPDIGQGVRRTIERRVRRWQDENDPDPSVTLRQCPSADKRFLSRRVVSDFLRPAHQGMLEISDLPAHARVHKSIHEILTSCRSGTLTHRNKALLALAVVCGIPLGDVAKYPVASCASLYRWKGIFLKEGYRGLMKPKSRENQRFEDEMITSVAADRSLLMASVDGSVTRLLPSAAPRLQTAWVALLRAVRSVFSEAASD
jgi:hypothetical protein